MAFNPHDNTLSLNNKSYNNFEAVVKDLREGIAIKNWEFQQQHNYLYKYLFQNEVLQECVVSYFTLFICILIYSSLCYFV